MSASTLTDIKSQGDCCFTVDEYLTRIGWHDGSILSDTPFAPSVSLATLRRLHRLHLRAIPFDNFDFHIEDHPIVCDPAVIWPKVKDGRRGTYCYQGNALFVQALSLMGFKAALIPVATWRPYAQAFYPLASHCNVIVSIGSRVYLADPATVDSIDDVLDLSVPLEQIRPTHNGCRYRFTIVENPYVIPPEMRQQLDALNSEYHADFMCDHRPSVSLALVKEDVKRDASLDPVIPCALEFTNRFALTLPLQAGVNPKDLTDASVISEHLEFPNSLPYRLCHVFLDYTAIKDTRSHHYKQWVGIRFGADDKHIISGFRHIVVKRPFSARQISRLAPETAHHEILDDADTVQQSFDKVEQVLIQDIGIKLNVEEKSKLKIAHNYTIPNIEVVWPY